MISEKKKSLDKLKEAAEDYLEAHRGIVDYYSTESNSIKSRLKDSQIQVLPSVTLLTNTYSYKNKMTISQILYGPFVRPILLLIILLAVFLLGFFLYTGGIELIENLIQQGVEAFG